MNSALKLTPIAGVNWGSRKFQQSFFGVGSDNVNFEPFQAQAGIYEIFIEGAAEQRLGENWLIKATARISDLQNSAANNPIVKGPNGSRTSFTGFLGLVWMF